LQQPCAHSSCTHRPSSSLIVAHPIKHRAFIHARAGERLAFVAACVHPRSSWRTSCVRRCSSMLMLENALRVCYAQVRSLYAPLLENACAHRRSCLQQP
jgi:hypothetical protein